MLRLNQHSSVEFPSACPGVLQDSSGAMWALTQVLLPSPSGRWRLRGLCALVQSGIWPQAAECRFLCWSTGEWTHCLFHFPYSWQLQYVSKCLMESKGCSYVLCHSAENNLFFLSSKGCTLCVKTTFSGTQQCGMKRYKTLLTSGLSTGIQGTATVPRKLYLQKQANDFRYSN